MKNYVQNLLRKSLLFSILIVGWASQNCVNAIPIERKIYQLQHKSWTSKDGVPPSITALEQADEGYLWIGTSAGLYHFDGVTFEQYEPKIGKFPNAGIFSLKAKPGGGIWIGWQQGGISLLENGILTNYGESEGIGQGTVWGFTYDRSGRLWAAGIRGVARLEHGHWVKMGPAEGYTAGRAAAVFTDQEGNVGVFSEKGLYLWPRGGARFNSPTGTLETRQPPQQGPDGKLYFLEKRGIRIIESLARYDKLDHPWIYESKSEDSGSMLIDSSGTLWYDYENNGIQRTKPEIEGAAKNSAGEVEGFSTKEGLSADTVGLFLEDKEKNIWVATVAGLDRFRQVDINRVQPGNSSDRFDAASITPDTDGTVWLGRRQSISSWIRVNEGGTVLDRQNVDKVQASLRNADGSVWLATKGGVDRYKSGRPIVRFVHSPEMAPENSIHSLAQDNDETIWASAIGSGIFHLIGQRWVRDERLVDGGKRAPMSMANDGHGGMWFGYANNKIARLLDGKVTIFSTSEGLSIGRVAALYAADGQVWAAGLNGLALLRSQKFTPLKMDAQRVNNISAMIIDSNGDFWLNSSAGVIQISSKEVRAAIANSEHIAATRVYSALDGIRGVAGLLQQKSIVEATDSKIWFSTRDSTAWIDKRNLLIPSKAPAVLIQSVNAAGARLIEPNDIKLDPNPREVQINYTSPILGTPERTKFKYMLRGYDTTWREVGTRRTAFYSDLPPGEYFFQVLAKNDGASWSEPGKGVKIAILPAYYQTWWFQTALGIIALLILGLIYRLHIQQLEKQLRMKMEVRQAERERIARELHDTLLQGTQAMILRVHNATERLPLGDPTRDLVNSALEFADSMLVQGRDRVLDLRAGDLFGTGAIEAIQRDGQFTAAEHSMAFEFIVEGKPRNLLPEAGHELYRIAMEAIINATRHSCGRKIIVKITYQFLALQLSVKDDGNGLPKSVIEHGKLHGHWGLPGLQERANRMRAKLCIKSLPNSGTEVQLRIPCRMAYVRRS
jgi:signal transduction histidine kinase